MTIVEVKRKDRIAKSARIKQYRTLMGLRSKELAAFLQLDQNKYSRLESGMLHIPNEVMETVEKLYKAWRRDEAERILAYLEKLYSV